MWVSLLGAITVIFVLSVIWVLVQQWARKSASQGPDGCDLPDASPLGCGHCSISEVCGMRAAQNETHKPRTNRKKA